MTNTAADVASQVGDHPALEVLARGGYAVNGLLHLLIAAIAVRIVIGQGGEADQSGALQAVAGAPAGGLMLWIGTVGYVGLALWQVLDAVTGYRPGGDAATVVDRAKDLAKAGVYAVLAWTTWRFAAGESTDSGESTADFTTALMGAPLGQVLVAGVGVAVLGVAGYHAWKGLSRGFLDDLDDNADGNLGRAVIIAGFAGYLGKALALAIVGALFGWAAWTTDPREASGLDGAAQTLSGSSGGAVTLALIAAGFVAYGLYSFARARYARL